ncbi:hypothetical protein [Actinophytocola sp.]|uniref:WD40 repeat domain-containing protein n=1 Tax=Actinophytocola sp. TaxID=1872138 RepID=UPI002ED68D59
MPRPERPVMSSAGALERELTGQARSTVAFTPDSRRVVTSCADGSVCVWPATVTGEPTIQDGHSGPVSSVAVSADGRLVASGGHEGTVRVRPGGGGSVRVLAGRWRGGRGRVPRLPGDRGECEQLA